MVNIGIIQMQSTPLKVQENLSVAGQLISQVAEENIQLIVLPEMFNTGFYFGEELMTVAETLNGKTINWLKTQAAKHNVYITTSVYERYEGHFYNTMVMIGSDGSVQQYRKRNPTWQEFAVWKHGDEPGPGIFDTPFGRIGGVICFDSFARETFEGFQQSEVDLIVIVACWGIPASVAWHPDVALSRLITRSWSPLASEIVPHQYATQLGVPVVFVNQGGITHTPSPSPRFWPFPALSNVGYHFHGKSSVRDASGTVLTQATGNETEFHAVASVDLPPRGLKPDVKRISLDQHYLHTDYYFVQPPFWAKVFQEWSWRGFQEEYKTRRNRYTV